MIVQFSIRLFNYNFLLAYSLSQFNSFFVYSFIQFQFIICLLVHPILIHYLFSCYFIRVSYSFTRSSKSYPLFVYLLFHLNILFVYPFIQFLSIFSLVIIPFEFFITLLTYPILIHIQSLFIYFLFHSNFLLIYSFIQFLSIIRLLIIPFEYFIRLPVYPIFIHF